jgi:RimJ/RimL family protein N-acetyltransferase
MNTDRLDELRTRRLLLTRLRACDVDDLGRMHTDARVMATLGGVRSAEATQQFLERNLAHWDEHGFGLWVARAATTGRFAGRGGLRHVAIAGADEVELSYAFMSDFWGQGLATELAAAAVRVAFEVLGRLDLVCFTLPVNRASQRVMEKNGFRHERDVIHADLPHALYRLTAAQWRHHTAKEPRTK